MVHVVFVSWPSYFYPGTGPGFVQTWLGLPLLGGRRLDQDAAADDAVEKCIQPGGFGFNAGRHRGGGSHVAVGDLDWGFHR